MRRRGGGTPSYYVNGAEFQIRGAPYENTRSDNSHQFDHWSVRRAGIGEVKK